MDLLISVNNLCKTFNTEILFKNVSFSLDLGEKVALIGDNGTGKSTLLKIIMGEAEYDSGSISLSKETKIGYLSQNVITSEENTFIDEINSVFSYLINLENDISDICQKMELEPNNGDLINQYNNLIHQYEINGGYEYQYERDMILTKFGFKEDMYNRRITTFSGGEKTKANFAKLLLLKPNLLILDEPTNHLDINLIEWLEDYLRNYYGAVLIATHDKYFINKVTKRIIEIDQNTANLYYGNYDYYLEEKFRRYELLLKTYNKQISEIAHYQDFVDRFRYKATKAKSAQDRIKKIDRLSKELIDKPKLRDEKISLNMESKRGTKAVILDVKNLAIGYEKLIRDNITFNMRGFDKLAIIGDNGIGKTTLLKTIMGELSPIKGSVEFHYDFKFGYFDQIQDDLPTGKTLFDIVHDLYPLFTLTMVRSELARLLFKDEDVFKDVSMLSGGEKVRLRLLLLRLEKPEMLFLDEPTNHLDIKTKDIVEEVFNDYESPIIFVSHDRYFINRIATKILAIFKDRIIFIDGNYDEYLKYISTLEDTKPIKIKITKPKTVDNKKLKEKYENEINSLDKRIKELKELQYQKEYYEDALKIKNLLEEIDQKEDTLHKLMEEYIEFSEM